MTIMIPLSPTQEHWLAGEVVAGRYPSIEAAVQVANDNLLPGDVDDLDWAKPYLDKARAGASRGKASSIASVRAQLEQRIRPLSTP
jgi:hypothetical protein